MTLLKINLLIGSIEGQRRRHTNHKRAGIHGTLETSCARDKELMGT